MPKKLYDERYSQHYARHLFTDLVTLLRRTVSGGGFDQVSAVASVEKYPVYGYFRPWSTTIEALTPTPNQTTSERGTHQLTLQQWPFDLDTTWLIECRGRIYKINWMSRIDERPNYLSLVLTELGRGEYESSYA